MKVMFWGKSIEFKSLGHSHIVLFKHNDHSMYNDATTSLENLVMGKTYL